MVENISEGVQFTLRTGEVKDRDNRIDGISDKNEVIASGVIVNRFDTPKVTLITLMVRGGRKFDKRNYPQFTLNTEEVKEAAKDFKTGDHVTIHGYIATSLDKKNNEFKDIIRATSIERTKSKLKELTLESIGKIRDIPTADFFVAGTVTKLEIFKNSTVHMLIRTTVDGKSAVGSFLYFPYSLEEHISDIQVGKRVCVVGEIQTSVKKEENGKSIFSQTNVVTDVNTLENILKIQR